ncbi:tyrosinase cofactor [Streptomyces sp. NPDC004111]|uniref:apotyrosinase chaperone MelC1 n=1 Tax=Streptomyces sp. NPDC004111 TaxID=3364690 RepID=UPI003697E252
MSRITRRQAMKAVVGTGAGTGIVLTGMATVWAATAPAESNSKPAPPGENGDPTSFDEVFQGRRIQGQPVAHAHGSGHGAHGGYRVQIDGRDLHVMHHENSGWSSAINHYERFSTPLDAARTAVISLKGASVVPFTPTA